MKSLLIEIQYLPSIRFFSRFFYYDKVLIDDTEDYRRGSYRNRCRIAGANGMQSLIVPVLQARKSTEIKQVRIDNHARWQHNHWQTLCSAYGKAPFFSHYADYFRLYYERHWDRLLDLNYNLIQTCLKLLKMPFDKISFLSENYEAVYETGKDLIHPKRTIDEDTLFRSVPYFQAFEERHGFMADMSIIDLLFNTGPESSRILQNTTSI